MSCSKSGSQLHEVRLNQLMDSLSELHHVALPTTPSPRAFGGIKNYAYQQSKVREFFVCSSVCFMLCKGQKRKCTLASFSLYMDEKKKKERRRKEQFVICIEVHVVERAADF